MKNNKSKMNNNIVVCPMCGSTAEIAHKKCQVKGAIGVRDIYLCGSCNIFLSKFLCQDSTRMAVVLYDGINFYKKTCGHLDDKWHYVNMTMFASKQDVEL